ncbi:hypothetical protein COV19_03520 [Candidatus Woesearchaeota archaeon CG10_big_fil_rev_8_21_14_0_10_44_13]|nr:MAG: hypothetical protein COV19_03520 [Candidatus Woesearchaeota archaeon CG10_big_fil_rev_8_21_14_0_10_44_13]
MRGFGLKNLFYVFTDNFHKSFTAEKDVENFLRVFNKIFGSDMNRFIGSCKKDSDRGIDLINDLNSHESKVMDYDKKELIGFLKRCDKDFPRSITMLQYPVVMSILKARGNIKVTEEQFSELNKMRDILAKPAWHFVDNMMPLIARRAAEIIGAKEKSISCMMIEEVIQSLEKSRLIVSEEELDKRHKLTVVVSIDSKRYLLSGKPAEGCWELFKKNVHFSSDILQGMPCYPGILEGEICRINDYRELDKIREKTILATYMTDIHYTPYLHKIKAILTEEGGLACHAVIVAREFKIPCITGIKGLMDSFKDKDRVEVDADKGIVRKIR